MLVNLSNLNSNLALTLGYLNLALNNSAQAAEGCEKLLQEEVLLFETSNNLKRNDLSNLKPRMHAIYAEGDRIRKTNPSNTQLTLANLIHGYSSDRSMLTGSRRPAPSRPRPSPSLQPIFSNIWRPTLSVLIGLK